MWFWDFSPGRKGASPKFVRGCVQEKNVLPGSRIFAFNWYPMLDKIGEKYIPKHKIWLNDNRSDKLFPFDMFLQPAPENLPYFDTPF